MPVATPQQYQAMMKSARENGYAYVAVNVTSLTTINAALKAFSDANCDGIIQVSTGGGKFASGIGIDCAAVGAVALAEATHYLASKYKILVGLHTDHCQPAIAEKFLDPLLKVSEKRVAKGKTPLFNSHMLDASTLPLEENLELSKKYLDWCKKLGIILELEIGVVGGEEDGVKGEQPDKLYTSPADMIKVHSKLGDSQGSYLLAATFGNVHGSYKPGYVKLKPEILREGQEAVEKEFGKSARFDLVFHGGSGSDLKDIRQALKYGVIKMNIDTDAQYAFTKPIALHICQNIEGVLKIDGEVGDKKVYDPRSYLKKAESSMAERLVEAADNLLCKGKSIYNVI